MKTFSILVGVLLCLVVIEGRHYEDRLESDTLDLESQDGSKKHTGEMRHRRRRWQNYGYEYPVPSYPFPYPERRDYDKNQQDYLPKIVKLLEEISMYMRRPLPPPQPIYVPYPVPYPVPQYSPCTSTTSGQEAKKPNITSRFPEMEDSNQNWGFVESDDDGGADDANDGARPISFDPIKPFGSPKRPTPKVDHGSVQADNQPTTKEPRFAESARKNPDICSASILSCCSDSNQLQCFLNFGCGSTFYKGNACSEASINNALNSFKAAYSPET